MIRKNAWRSSCNYRFQMEGYDVCPLQDVHVIFSFLSLLAGDVEHPISINSSRTASSHTSSRQTPESSRSTGPLRVVRYQGATSSMQQLEDGVESYLGGYPIVTWHMRMHSGALHSSTISQRTFHTSSKTASMPYLRRTETRPRHVCCLKP
jgi:hypothetical protein